MYVLESPYITQPIFVKTAAHCIVGQIYLSVNFGWKVSLFSTLLGFLAVLVGFQIHLNDNKIRKSIQYPESRYKGQEQLKRGTLALS